MTLFNGESWPPTFGDEVRSRLGHHLVFTININLPFVCKYTIPVLGCPGMGLGSDQWWSDQWGFPGDSCWSGFLLAKSPRRMWSMKTTFGTLQRRRDLRLTKFDPTDVNEKFAVWKIPKVRKKFKVEGFLSIRTTFLGTKISHQKSLLKMIFLLPRWDMLVPWRVSVLRPWIDTPQKFSPKKHQKGNTKIHGLPPFFRKKSTDTPDFPRSEPVARTSCCP